MMAPVFPLAIFAPTIGSRSETFIKRHVSDLLPQKTVVVCGRERVETSDEWGVEGPILELSKIPPMSLLVQFERILKKSVGFQLKKYDREYLKQFLVSNGVKVILCEYLDYAIQWIDIVEDLGIRMYAHAHGYDVSIRLRDPVWVEAYKELNRLSGIITMNAVSRERLVDIGIKRSIISVIPYGIDLPEDKARFSTNSHVRCLAVGRMTGKKAPLYAIESFRRALNEYPDMTLDYVGDGELMPAVLQFVDAFGLDGKVKLHRSQPNTFVQNLMEECDVFIQHSITCQTSGDEEGLPVAILEAMAHGLPVVSTTHAGIPEAVEDKITGFLVEEGQVDLMAEKIVLLAKDKVLRENLGRFGRIVAENKFSWEIEKKRMLEVMGF